MEITAVEELSKSRSRVYIDGEAAFALYRGELRAYGIYPGAELSGKDYDVIVNEVLPKRARLRAMNLLAKREYTVKQLCDKLKAGFYPQQAVEDALAYVAGFRYTDDLRYAVGYITGHESTRSRLRIEQDLIGKGIDRRTLEKAWLEWEKQGGSQDEGEMIRELLAKRKFEPDRADMQEKRRVYAYLLRKGFSAEAVSEAMHANAEG